MTPEELLRELAAGTLRPAYLLLGSEPLLQDETFRALKRAVLGDAPSDFDFDRLDASQATPGRLLDALRTLPVLSPRRLVWLRGDGGRDARGLLAALPEAIETAERAQSVLVVSWRVDGGRRPAWARAFEPAGRAVICEAPRGRRALVAFVRREAERQGVSLAPDAAEQLVERVGGQLLLLRQEIAKAALLAGETGRVRVEHVVAGTGDVAEEPIWELTDAIGAGRSGDALVVLGKLRAAGSAPPVLLAAMAAHLRRLLRVRSGGSVPGPPFVVEKLSRQAARAPAVRWLSGLRAIHETDEILKGRGGLDADLALERLVLALSA